MPSPTTFPSSATISSYEGSAPHLRLRCSRLCGRPHGPLMLIIALMPRRWCVAAYLAANVAPLL